MNHKKTVLLVAFISVLSTAFGIQTSPEHKILFEKAKFTMETKGDLNGAINLFNDIIKKYPKEREYAAKSQLYIGLCYEKLGVKEAQKAYRKVIDTYPEQIEAVKLANKKLSLLSRAEAVHGKEDKEFSITRVKEGIDVGIFGAISPDGRYLSYADNGPLDLAVYEIATGSKRILMKGEIYSDAYHSRWSPHGKLLAYEWYEEGKFELRVIGMDGTDPRVLYKDDNVPYLELCDWSPDGKSIVSIFNRKDNTWQMVLVSILDGSVKVLKNFGGRSPGRSRFSPDGHYIAYSYKPHPDSREQDIFIFAPNGEHEIPLVQNPANDDVLDWTPDGNGILFRSDRTGNTGIWLIRIIEGRSVGTPELLKPDIETDFVPMGFSRNGIYYYGAQKEMKDVYIAGIDLVTGKLISPPVLATQRFAGSNHSPDWSADGKELVYLSQRATGAWGVRTICIRSGESGKEREITSKLNQLSWVRWSTDGSSLLTAGPHPNGGYGQFRINIQTGDYEPLLRSHIGWPAVWSRDGKAIFSCHDTTNDRIPIVMWDLKTHQEKKLYSLTNDSSYYTSGLALSPDGRNLAFSVSESGQKIIKVLPVNGGVARELLREDKSMMSFAFGFGTVAWTPDGWSVLFVRQTSPSDSKRELWRIPLEEGKPQKLDLAADNMRELSVHPDGRQIAFTAGKIRSELWMMENFLPE